MSDVNLSISAEVVQPIIDAKINAAVCEALSGTNNIVSSVVTKILNEKVDSEGKTSRYSSRDEQTFIQWLCNDAIKKASIQAIQNYINAANAPLCAAVQAVLMKNTKTIAQNLVSSFVEATKSNWSLKVDVNVDPKK